jgi:chemotaxis response regulator CheB
LCAAFVIVQHVDARFAPTMASWLNEQSGIPVELAVEGAVLTDGLVLFSNSDRHLVFRSSNVLGYNSEPRELSYRPSIDVFFNSIVKHWKGRIIGVLLTGMGRDGAAGLKALRTAGALTIAQDETTCMVYGMPKAAAELVAATSILPLAQIGPAIRASVAPA